MDFGCPVRNKQLYLIEHGLDCSVKAAKIELEIENLEAQIENLDWAGEENQHALAKASAGEDCMALLLLQADAVAQAAHAATTRLQALYAEAAKLNGIEDPSTIAA